MIQEKKKVLGRGLASLIPAARTTTAAAPPAAPRPAEAGAEESTPGEKVQEIRLEEIEPSPYQPRRGQDEVALEELAQSIRAQGVLQPIVLRYISGVDGRWPTVDGGNGSPHPNNTGLGGPPANLSGTTESLHPISPNAGEVRVGQPPQIKYQLIAGERRWLASKRAGRATVPAIVRQVSNQQAMEMALIENLQREDLDCMEMAFAFERLSREFGLTQDEMAKRTGKDRSTISNLLRLLKLPPEIRQALTRHELSFGHAKELLELEDATVQLAAAQKVMRDNLSVRGTELLVNHLIYLGPVSEKEWQDRQRKLKEHNEDPNVRAARMDLETRLGCRVKIHDKNGKGRVVIEYKTLEDFDRILEALGK